MGIIFFIIAVAIIYYVLSVTNHSSKAFWKIAAKNPDFVYARLVEDDVWIIDDGISKIDKNKFDGPFFLPVPSVGKTFKIYGKVGKYEESQKRIEAEFMKFNSKRPTLDKKNISDFEKVVEFINWFIKNEPIVKALNNQSNHIIYNEGYRPLLEMENISELITPKVDTVLKLFAVKFFYDINTLKNANKNEFEQFIDNLDKLGEKTLLTAGNIGIKYKINYLNLRSKKEFEKITNNNERESFKINFLTDNFIGAEIRIMAWLYHDYFGEWYKIKK